MIDLLCVAGHKWVNSQALANDLSVNRRNVYVQVMRLRQVGIMIERSRCGYRLAWWPNCAPLSSTFALTDGEKADYARHIMAIGLAAIKRHGEMNT
jgi:biotin operon repressor